MTAGSLADRASAGATLDPAEALRLATLDPLALGAAADRARRRLHGDAVLLVSVLPAAWSCDAGPGPDAGEADEVRLEGPPPDGAAASDLLARLGAVAAAHPGAALRALTPAEAAAAARASGASPAALLRRLRDGGLAGLLPPAPGDDPAEAIATLAAAAEAGLAVDAPLAYGHGDGPGEIAAAALALRALPADRVRAVAPLPAAPPDASPLSGTTGLQDLRAFALARLLLPGAWRVAVEADRVGSKLGAVALSAGADALRGALAIRTERLRPQDAEKPRPFNLDRALLLLAECGRPAIRPGGGAR